LTAEREELRPLGSKLMGFQEGGNKRGTVKDSKKPKRKYLVDPTEKKMGQRRKGARPSSTMMGKFLGVGKQGFWRGIKTIEGRRNRKVKPGLKKAAVPEGGQDESVAPPESAKGKKIREGKGGKLARVKKSPGGIRWVGLDLRAAWAGIFFGGHRLCRYKGWKR